MDPGACHSVGLWFIHALYLVTLGLLPWDYLAAILLWVSSCSGFSAFQAFFCLYYAELPVKCKVFQPVYLV